MPRPRTATLAATLITITTLAACSSPTPPAQPNPTSQASQASQLVSPVITPYGTNAVTVPLDNVIVITDAPENLTASITPAGSLEFIPATTDATMTTNPGLKPLQAGPATVTLSAPDGTSSTMTVTVTDPAGTGALTPPATNASDAATAVLGMTDPEAQAYTAANGVQYRIGRIDTQTMPTTRDYREDRITVEIDNGTITRATVG